MWKEYYPAFSKALLNTLGSSIAFVIAVNAFTIPGCSFKFILTSFPVTSLDNRSLRYYTLSRVRKDRGLYANGTILRILSPKSLIVILDICASMFIADDSEAIWFVMPDTP